MTDDQVRPLHRSSSCTVYSVQANVCNEKCYTVYTFTCQWIFAKVIITAPIIKFHPVYIRILCDEEVSAFNKCIHLRPTKAKQDGATYDQIKWQSYVA